MYALVAVCVLRSEEEEAKKIPYEAEINLCDYLVTYLEHFLVPSNAEAENANASKTTAELEVDGQVLRAYRRDDDDEDIGRKKKGKKNKKQQIAGVKHDRIVHSVGTHLSSPLAMLTQIDRVRGCTKGC